MVNIIKIKKEVYFIVVDIRRKGASNSSIQFRKIVGNRIKIDIKIQGAPIPIYAKKATKINLAALFNR
jgi:hypothetical protein